MKAAVMYQPGQMPRYVTDYAEPVAAGREEVVITMKAAAIKHIDKSRAGGEHYSTRGSRPGAKVVGGDGVGLLPNGARVFALGNGMIAERAVIEKDRMIRVPEGVDDATAAALPNAVAGSAMALLFRAKMKKGETVLINGATGFTGKIAVQVAKYYGAKTVIVTGRNEATLAELKQLGADQALSLRQEDTGLIAQIKAIHQATPIDVIIDYLWGHSAELVLSALAGQGRFTHRVRFVSIGSITGDKIQLSAEILRSTDLHLSGSGLGSWTQPEMRKLFRSIVPRMFRLAARHRLQVDTATVRLEDMETLWDQAVPDGKRLVVIL